MQPTLVIQIGQSLGTLPDRFRHAGCKKIEAVLDAARAEWEGRLVAVFQPHLYSRTRDFAESFGDALSLADKVWVTDVYAAREQPMSGIDGKLVADWVTRAGSEQVSYVADVDELPTRLLEALETGDLVVVMGAGDIDRVAHELFSRMRTLK